MNVQWMKEVEGKFEKLSQENERLNAELQSAQDKIFLLEKQVGQICPTGMRNPYYEVDDYELCREEIAVRGSRMKEALERQKLIGKFNYHFPEEIKPRLTSKQIDKRAKENNCEIFIGIGSGNRVQMAPDHSKVQQQLILNTPTHDKYKNYPGGWYYGVYTLRMCLLGLDHKTVLKWKDMPDIENKTEFDAREGELRRKRRLETLYEEEIR